jgi:adenine deaminase
VVTGTDSPLDNVAVSTHQNLRAMVAFGFTPYEALTTATRNPARWLGLEDRIGVLKPGAYADLSLVSGNPLQDIKAAANVRTVMVGGVLRTVGELLAPYRNQPGARAATEVAPAARSAEKQHWWHVPEWSEHVCCAG